jgi:hypothetical protein
MDCEAQDTNKAISMKTLIVKSLLSSLYQREGIYPSLAKRGKRRFFNNDALLMHSLVSLKSVEYHCHLLRNVFRSYKVLSLTSSTLQTGNFAIFAHFTC